VQRREKITQNDHHKKVNRQSESSATGKKLDHPKIKNFTKKAIE